MKLILLLTCFAYAILSSNINSESDARLHILADDLNIAPDVHEFLELCDGIADQIASLERQNKELLASKLDLQYRVAFLEILLSETEFKLLDVAKKSGNVEKLEEAKKLVKSNASGRGTTANSIDTQSNNANQCN